MVERRLKEYVAAQMLPFKTSVVMGSSGSYKEEDIISFLELHLGEWGPGSEWEILFLDAYAPGRTDNVQRLAWSRGRILMTHGGGTSPVGQTNDTDLHCPVRKSFIEKQSDMMIRKARRAGGGMVDLTREENIDVMIEVMSDKDLHLRASLGYLLTGTMLPLDGSLDHKVCREAADFWKELNMRERINSAVAEVEAKFNAGKLPWNNSAVRALIEP